MKVIEVAKMVIEVVVGVVVVVVVLAVVVKHEEMVMVIVVVLLIVSADRDESLFFLKVKIFSPPPTLSPLFLAHLFAHTRVSNS